jgi:hypothetical protein
MLGVLSWKAPRTIAATLENHAAAGLPGHFARAAVFFQEIAAGDAALAARCGYEALGSAENLGIWGGVKALAEALEAEFLLLLENDHILAEPEADPVPDIADSLARAVAELRDGATVVRMRSRARPGDGRAGLDKYLRAFAVHDPLPGADGPLATAGPVERALRLTLRGQRETLRQAVGVHAERDPVARHPGVIRRSAHGNFLASSAHAPWTNQCYLIRRDFLLGTLLPMAAASALAGPPATRTIETNLPRRWWREGGFTVAFADPGLFTHRRLDR